MAATSNPTTRIPIQRALLFFVFNSNLCATNYSADIVNLSRQRTYNVGSNTSPVIQSPLPGMPIVRLDNLI